MYQHEMKDHQKPSAEFIAKSLEQRRVAKKQPISLAELDRRQAHMNSPQYYAALGSMGSKGTSLDKSKEA